MYLSLTTFLLSQPQSVKSKHHRYLLASTVGQQLTIQLHQALSRLRRYADSDGLRDDDEFDLSRRATVTLDELTQATSPQPSVCALDTLTFPLQLHNALYSVGQAVEELVYRSVDMLNVLTQIAAQHSVCSTEHVLFLLRALRSSPQSSALCPLPSLLQLSIVQLLRAELPYHSPHWSGGFGASDVRLEDELCASLSSMLLEGHVLAAIAKRKEADKRRKDEAAQKSDRRLPSDSREEKGGKELSAQAPVKERAKDGAQYKDKERSEGKEKEKQDAQRPSSAATARSGNAAGNSGGLSFGLRALQTEPSMSPPSASSSASAANPLASSLDLSALPSPHSPTASSSAKKTSSFRRIAALICPECRYIEFLACPYHRCYLTREHTLSTSKATVVTLAACAESECDVSTLTCSTWRTCRHCCASHDGRSLHFFHISEREAAYCAEAIKCNGVPLLRHNLFFCNRCRVAEFPGTKHGGLTLNIEGFLYDLPTHRFLLPSAYQFTHLSAKCQGEVELLSVRLSREEATYLGRLTRKTQPIDLAKPPIDVEPLPPPSFSSSASAPTQSPASPARLHEPWGYSSWQVSATGRAAVLAEMVTLVRVLFSTARKSAADDGSTALLVGHSAIASQSVQTSPSHSRAGSMFHSPRPDRRGGGGHAPSLRTQWREALYAKLRGCLLTTTSLCDALSHEAPPPPSSYLSSLLALLVLGGHVNELYPGAHVSFRADSYEMRGLVRRFDPTVATVSIAVTRGSTDSADSAASASLSTASMVELAVDEVRAESEVAPPSLAALGLVADVVHVGQKLLTARSEGSVNAFLLSRLQHALVVLMQAQLAALSTSSSLSLTSSAPLSSLLQPLLMLARPALSLYPMKPSHLHHAARAARDELHSRLSAALSATTSSHAAFLATVHPPRSDDVLAASSSGLQSHAPSRSSSLSHSTLILPMSEAAVEPPVMPIILMHLAQLTEMGFSSIAARFALEQSRGDVSMATNAILTDHIYEDGDIDENAAMERWDQLLDRLNVRAEVDAWNAYMASQQQQQQQQQQQAAPTTAATAAAGGGGGGGGSPSGVGALSGSGDGRDSGGRGGVEPMKESEAERDRKLASLASSVYLAHRFLWPNEEPEQPDPASLPMSPPPSATPPLTSNPQPYQADPGFSQQHLLHALLSGALLHTFVLITEEAASVYNKPTKHARKGYKPGDKLHIVDLVNKVCPAEVVEVNASGSKIYIHYSGWSKKWSTLAPSTRSQHLDAPLRLVRIVLCSLRAVVRWLSQGRVGGGRQQADSATVRCRGQAHGHGQRAEGQRRCTPQQGARAPPPFPYADLTSSCPPCGACPPVQESECVVQDVQVKENQLKLLIHYVGWGEKWSASTCTHARAGRTRLPALTHSLTHVVCSLCAVHCAPCSARSGTSGSL